MKILLCHNYYQQRGGEDECFEEEARLLEARGHAVVRFTRHNGAVDAMGRGEVARKTLWNGESYASLKGLIRRERPAVLHCVNTFPLISPSAYYAARAEGVAVVQELHNYRLLCPNALLLRDGKVCEDCVGKGVPWPAVAHGCYRGSRAASAVVAGLLTAHRALRTWTRAVDVYTAPTEFTRRKLIAGGLPAGRIVVRPNCVDPDPGPGTGRGGHVVFAGRLSPEKGVDTLLAAWQRLPSPVRLKVFGDGPMADAVRLAAARDARIEWLGRRPLPEVLDAVGEAACLVLPSVTYETFGRTIVEGFAKGTPAVVSDRGAMAELVDPGRTGLRFRPGDADDLARSVRELLADPAALAAMRRAARAEYESKYTAESNYRALMDVYERALSARGEPGASATGGDE